MTISIVAKIPRRVERVLKEAIHIKLYPDNMNRKKFFFPPEQLVDGSHLVSTFLCTGSI